MRYLSDNQSEILARIAELRTKFEVSPAGLTYVDILSALEQFTECVRYLKTRRSKGTKLGLENEAAVQDAIYLMLRPWIHDLVYENPTDKTGNRYAIKDFLSKSAKSIIEAKYIRDDRHGKEISRELHDDIEMYRRHPHCEHLILFMYDPDSYIPDVEALRVAIEEERVYGGRPLHCHLVVKP